MIGSVDVLLKDQSHIYLHDFLNVAKSLNLKGDDWQFLTPPFNPKDAVVPTMAKIPAEQIELYKTYNWGYLTPIIIIVILFTIPAFFISPEDPTFGIVIFILWIPFILLMAHHLNIGKAQSITRKRKLTQEEIAQLEQEALEKYQKDINAYRKLRDEYESKEYEFRQRLNSQSILLGRYAKLIVSTIFKRCLMNNVQIEDCVAPPQRGISEDELFYALMKEFPAYVKVDKSLGVYSPDLVIFNGHSCPIDIEIDESYPLAELN